MIKKSIKLKFEE